MAEQHQPTSAAAPWITSFRDYVGSLPHRWVLDNLLSGGADTSRRIVSSAMVKEAVAAFADAGALTGRFRGLPPALRVRCAQVYLMGGAGLSLSADPTAYRREPLLASLLVLAAHGGPGIGGVRLFGFREFEPALRPLLAEELCGFGDAGECPVSANMVLPWRPLSDVAVVCSLAAQGQLTRNAHGGFSRTALSTLKRLVHDPTLSGRGTSDGGPGYPAGFLIGYCLNEELIADAGTEYALNRQKLSAWLNLSMRERLHNISAYAEEFLDGTGIELALELFRRADGRWIAVNQILPETDRQALIRTLGVFEFLGRVHTASTHNGPRFAPCLTAADADAHFADAPKRGTVIMPDFSVLIPQEVSPTELFDFSDIGMLNAFDKVYNGRITKESVSNALSAGVEADKLRGWLQQFGAAANVVKTVDEWIREFSRMFVSCGTALASCEETVTKQIAALEPLRKHLTKIDAHTVFMIKQGSERKVLAMLKKLGFDTRAPGKEAGNMQAPGRPNGILGPYTPVEETADAVHRGADPDYDADIDDLDRPMEPEDDTPDAKSPRAVSGGKRYTPITDFSAAPDTLPPQSASLYRTKYGSGLKALDPAEMIQVVDYAMLTNQALVIDYDGSAFIKRSIYTVVPLGLDKGIDAAVEAEIPYIRGRKQFYLDKIKRIAVVAQQ